MHLNIWSAELTRITGSCWTYNRNNRIRANGLDALEIIVNGSEVTSGVSDNGWSYFVVRYQGSRFSNLRNRIFSCKVSPEASNFECYSWPAYRWFKVDISKNSCIMYIMRFEKKGLWCWLRLLKITFSLQRNGLLRQTDSRLTPLGSRPRRPRNRYVMRSFRTGARSPNGPLTPAERQYNDYSVLRNVYW